jgi:hypothetical protein
VVEIPVRVQEKRPPSINLFKRVPHVMGNLARLTYLFWNESAAPEPHNDES